MKEGNANMSFKKSERSAYRSRRSPQLTPRFPQATLVEGRDEDFHSVDSVHFPTTCNLVSKQRRRSLTCREKFLMCLSASHALRSRHFTLGKGWCRHQTLFRDSHIFSGDWRTVYSAFAGPSDCVAWPHRIDSAPLIDGGRVWFLVLSSRQIRRSVQIASLGHIKFISSICKSN